MTTIVMLRHKHMKVVMSSHFHHMLCVFRQIKLKSLDLYNERAENEIAVFS